MSEGKPSIVISATVEPSTLSLSDTDNQDIWLSMTVRLLNSSRPVCICINGSELDQQVRPTNGAYILIDSTTDKHILGWTIHVLRKTGPVPIDVDKELLCLRPDRPTHLRTRIGAGDYCGKQAIASCYLTQLEPGQQYKIGVNGGNPCFDWWSYGTPDEILAKHTSFWERWILGRRTIWVNRLGLGDMPNQLLEKLPELTVVE